MAVLGTGAMGARVAQRLLVAGHEVRVFNRTRSHAEPLVAHGAMVADSARDALRGADVVISMVTDDAASRAVWLDADTGALVDVPTGALVLESSTVSPEWTRTLGAAARARGVRFLDAPVLGSRPQAEAGQLIYLVGGAAEYVDAVRPVLAALSAAVHHVGGVGDGATAKLAVNALFATQVAAVAEWVKVLPGAVLDVLHELPVMSPAASGALGLMRAGKTAPLFPISLMAKDLRYAQALAEELPVTRAVGARFAEAEGRGLGSLNISAVGG
ncbi:MAG: NAD(P)-dependent oxidoreductase [Gemmatimonadaceae bacterium]|nr:NAD(P)-dependent oxidoreductase [Gemmatimonadaceae bacterium]